MTSARLIATVEAATRAADPGTAETAAPPRSAGTGTAKATAPPRSAGTGTAKATAPPRSAGTGTAEATAPPRSAGAGTDATGDATGKATGEATDGAAGGRTIKGLRAIAERTARRDGTGASYLLSKKSDVSAEAYAPEGFGPDSLMDRALIHQ